MLSRVLAWKVVVTAGFFMTANTGHLRSWLARQQALHGHVAQPARRDIRDAQQADVVVRIDQGLEVSEEIADLAPVEEALAANEVVAHAGLAQGGFQRAGLGVGAKEDRLVRPGHALRQPRVFDLLGDGPGLLLVVGEGVQRDLRAVALLRPELLAAAADVVLDDGVGGVEDGVGGAVVLLQLDDLGLREMLLHVEQVGYLRAAPAVDALVVIADDAQVAMLAGQGLDELELRGVGVLVFVHHHVAVFGAAGFQRLGMLLEEPEREQDQVVEIHGIAGAQGGFVAGPDVLRHRADAGIAEDRGALAAVAESAQQAEDRRRVGLFPFGGDLRQDLLNGPQLLRLVIDDEVALVAQLLDMLAQDAHAQRVEGADSRLSVDGVRVASRCRDFGLWTSDFGLSCGSSLATRSCISRAALLVKVTPRMCPGAMPRADHVRDAESNDPRLAGSGAGKNQDRAVNRLHGLSLLRVERTQIEHRARSLGSGEVKARGLGRFRTARRRLSGSGSDSETRLRKPLAEPDAGSRSLPPIRAALPAGKTRHDSANSTDFLLRRKQASLLVVVSE